MNVADLRTNARVPAAPSTRSRFVAIGNVFPCVSACTGGLRKRNETMRLTAWGSWLILSDMVNSQVRRGNAREE